MEVSELRVEPVIGWRVWSLALEAGRPVLHSPIREARWPAGAVMRARCVDPRCRGAGPSSSCGLYSYRSEDLIEPDVETCVTGSIALWGRVVEHERGYRGQLGYPQRLRLDCTFCRLTRGLRGAPPTVVLEVEGRALAVCPDHSDGDRAVSGQLDAATVQAALLDDYGVELLPRPALRPAWPRPRARLTAPPPNPPAARRRGPPPGPVRFLGYLAAAGLWWGGAIFLAVHAARPFTGFPLLAIAVMAAVGLGGYLLAGWILMRCDPARWGP